MATPSLHDETAFMAALLADLDDQFWNAVPTPDPSPKKPPPATPTHRPRLPISPSRVFSAGDNVDLTELLAGAEDWDWDDTFSDMGSPKKSPRKSPIKAAVSSQPEFTPEICTRCIVENITHSDHCQKTLVVKVASTSERRIIHLHDDWTTTSVRPGDVMNVIGSFSITDPFSTSPSSISITAKSNLLILHPDLLLTSTALSNAPQCRRKPLISGLVRSSNEATPVLVWGRMLHEVVQDCLAAGTWEKWRIDAKILQVIQTPVGLENLVMIGATVDEAVRELQTRAKGLLSFAEKYISQVPKSNAVLTNTRTTRAQRDSLLAIAELLDIEEDIWSPTYGLKGKLDATIHAVISDPVPPVSLSLMQPAQHQTTCAGRAFIDSGKDVLTFGPRPFEIKTGRAVAGMEHRAQTMLYTLLAQERYSAPVEEGLLYYTQSEEVVRVPVGRNELRGLIIARNEMAGYLTLRGKNVDKMEEGRFLPPTIDDERICNRCFSLDPCMLYRRAVENVIDTTSPIASTYALKTAHLTDDQAAFFKKWERLIALEEQDSFKFKKELWTMGAREREKKGRCFADVVLDESFNSELWVTQRGKEKPGRMCGEGEARRRFTYRFVRRRGLPTQQAEWSLLSGLINPGDAVTISVDTVAGLPNQRFLALARGFVLDLAPTSLEIDVDHEVNPAKLLKRLGMEGKETEVVFRIDRDEMSTGIGRIRDNLSQLFYAEGDKRRLELVVDLRAPVFEEHPVSEIPSSNADVNLNLNPNQLKAIHKVLCAKDYALVLGMPGTGKTTVVVEIIKSLVKAGKTVLLTSYTHSAVDTILGKLVEGGMEEDILRLGNVDKVHPDVKRLTLASKAKATTTEELERRLTTPAIVATTCLSVDHALFERRKFDYCIVDEASQITLPTCLGPLRYAEKFVLVGDHFQLPPLVRNTAARKGGFDVSLFRRLSDAHPHAVVDLAYQYRMNEDIMMLSNKLIYGDRLQCGSEEVRKRSLRLPDGGVFLRDVLHGVGAKKCAIGQCWLKKLLDESCKAVFVDTDAVPARDSRVGDLVQNETEAEIVCQIVGALVKSGVKGEQIAVLSLYRQQVKLLSHLLYGDQEGRKGVEILTADRSQGRDKDCVVISMVRSNETGHVGDVVKDWRRMNVSFTRARSKLVIIGSKKTLQEAAILSEFFDLMERQQWILRLPKDAHLLHPHVSCATFGLGAGSPSPGRAKRVARQMMELPEDENGVEQQLPVGKRAVKKVKVDVHGLLRGRPILRDLVNDIEDSQDFTRSMQC